MSSDERKEWVSVTHSPTSGTLAKVTLQQGNVVARWTVKTFVASIPTGIREARTMAEKALADTQEALR